ncbi:outer envelope protein 39, chloroplastic-like [Prosopis cineraria]|uniref:outer envelope protein 39, chloroplastic-like n=1 Tax=Prosopis cineraria TaxID=364024 RepID=UPI0024104B3E|nr:outer envelope protein 39, chloroplastic-like [Prosopis cineraria]
MGAHKSIHVDKAKLEIRVNFLKKLCCSRTLPPLSATCAASPFSMAIGRFCVKHNNLFGRSETLDVSLHKGLHDSNLLIAFRRPLPLYIGQPCITLQHVISPEVGIHGIPTHKFSHSSSGDVRSSKLSIGFDYMDESSASSNWSTTTSVNFKQIHFMNDGGRSISRDLDGFPVSFSGNSFDNMIVVKQESKYERITNDRFSYLSLQMEQGIPCHSNLMTFNRFKIVASRGLKIGPTFFSTRVTGGSIVGSIAPHLAFAIGGPDSVRGYGEGAVGSGQSCLVSRGELTFPLNERLEGVVFLDSGSDLRSSHKVPGNPGVRKGKPGSGFGIGCGIRLKYKLAHITVDYAMNAFQQGMFYFGINMA